MCRWVVYAGPAIFLEEILFKQEYSLVRQSISARESAWKTNGDGFGVAWYGKKAEPGLFRDVLPAWNDNNLRSLANQIESRLFFAHVRASTGSSVSRSNCHPFTYKNWAFMHNGKIGGWDLCRKEIESLIDQQFYCHRHGTTDSEALLMVALTEGLQNDPAKAFQRALSKVLNIMNKHSVEEPMRISAACTNGQQIWAFRFSTDKMSPSLYFGTPKIHAEVLSDQHITTIASEPSDDDASHWHSVEEGTGLLWSDGKVSTFELEI